MTQLSYQLYSSRNHPPLSETLQMLAGIGYDQVEGYGALYADALALDDLREGLLANGLTMPTGHFSLEMAQSQVDRVKTIAEALGIEAVFVPYIAAPDRPTDSAGWTAFGRELARIGEPYWAAGLAFGWHNHDFEVIATPQGDLPLDLIMAADPRLSLELDVAWVAVAGVDPKAVIGRHADRILAAHIKDIAPKGEKADEDGWADVGLGTLDWAGLMKALRQTSCKYFVIEHDNPSDHRRFARASFATVSAF